MAIARHIVLCLTAIAASAAQPPSGGTALSAESGTRLLSSPAISERHVAFLYAGNVWVAGIDGSNPRRLTSVGGIESTPVFSPDGRRVAFTAGYDGNLDVYVVPVDGGAPTRLTWHPVADIAQAFTPDGSGVLFTSRREAFTLWASKLHVVPVEGGFPKALAIPSVSLARYSPDGRQLVYNPLREAFNTWKNYRGGRVSTLWIYQTGSHATERIPQPEIRSNDTDPMWIADVIYFRSDRAGEFNLFSFDMRTKAVHQLTNYDDFPILHASMGAGKIVYERAGYLYIFDPATSQNRQIPIEITTDLAETRPRWAKGTRHLRNVAISPTGVRAVFEFRGEIVTVPAENGDPRNITRSTDANDKAPAWSPDGTRVAYFSDQSGEYELVVKSQDGRGEPRRYKLTGAGIYERMAWSPDSKKIAYVDISQTMYLVDVQSGVVKKIAQDEVVGFERTLYPAWSPDSRWIAYTLANQNYIRRAHVYSVEQDRSRPVSDGLSDIVTPAFDRSGKYLYFLSSTDAGPARQWFMQANLADDARYSIYVAVLRRDLPSPLAPRSDEEGVVATSPTTNTAADDDSSSDVNVRIDFEDLPQRILELPLPAGEYRDLQTGAAGKIFYRRTTSLQRFDLEERKAETVVAGTDKYHLSADGKKILYRSGDSWFIVPASGKAKPSQGRIAADEIEIYVDPRAEWRQIYEEAWRINRDLFYAPNMHGADWPAIREKYRAFLPHLTTRDDLTRVLNWMVSELATGHHGANAPFAARTSVPGGLLGADYVIENGRYRFAKVYGGLNWNPRMRAPLTEPGVNIEAGEYLLAVNGRDLRPPTNLFSMFENTAEKIITITVGPNPDGIGARTVSVVPIADEGSLRNRAWVERNIQTVDSATGGRVAYVYVPDTGVGGYESFVRYFYPQSDKDAIIVDERFNSGGFIPDYYIDMLKKPYFSHWAMRYGEDLRTPTATIQGPKVLLIDEMAGSGGDLFAYMWHKFGLGPMIGKATWGGVVGHWTSIGLMDGGRVSSPNLGIWTEEGFIVENVGVPPDIEIEQTPALVVAGRDPQLEKAIEVVLEELKKNPPPKYQRPPFPVRVCGGARACVRARENEPERERKQ